MTASRPPINPRVAVAAALGLAAMGLVALAALWGGDRADETATAPSVAPARSAAAPGVAPPAAPSLDLVRVEPDGAAMLAGRAAPNAVVAIRAGGTLLATAEADASGAFVATFDAAPGGPRDLTVAVGGAPEAELALTLPEPEGGFVPAAGGASAGPAPTPAPAPEPAAEPAAEPAPPAAAGPVEVAAVTPEPAPPAPPSAPASPDAAAPRVARSAPLPRPAPRPGAALPATVVVVEPGGTLWTLAREHYGAGRRYPLIVTANDEIEDPALIFPGQRFVLPPAAQSD